MFWMLLAAGAAAGADTPIKVEFGGADNIAIFWTAEHKVGFASTRTKVFTPSIDRVIIPAIYDWSSGFSGDTAAVIKDGAYGVIDTAGRPVVPIAFEYASNCERGYAIVYKGGLAGLWDCKRRAQWLKPQFATVQLPSKLGLVAAVDQASGKWGVVRPDGKPVIPFEYLILNHAEEGLTSVMVGKAWKMLGPDGTVIDPAGTNARVTPVGTVIFKDPASSKYGLMTMAGKVLAAATYDSLDCDSGVCSAKSGGTYAPLDPATGRKLGTEQYGRLSSFKTSTIAGVSREGPFQYLGRDGRPLYGRSFEKVQQFDDQGWARVRESGKWGVIDKSGRAVVPSRFDGIEIGNKVVFVRSGNCWGVRDAAGRELLAPRYQAPLAVDPVNPFASQVNGGGFYWLKTCDGQYSVADDKFRTVLAPGRYSNIGPVQYRSSTETYVASIERDGKAGVYDLSNNREIIAPTYERLSVDGEYALDIAGGRTEAIAYGDGTRLASADFDFAAYEPAARTWIVTRPMPDGGKAFAMADARGKLLTGFDYVQPPSTSREWKWGLDFGVRPPIFVGRTRDKALLLTPRGTPIGSARFDRFYKGDEPGTFWFDEAIDLAQAGQLVLVDKSGAVIARAADFRAGAPESMTRRRFGSKSAAIATFSRSGGKGKHRRILMDGQLFEAAGGNLGSSDLQAEFSEGLMPVRVNGKFGYIDVLGRMVIAPKFDAAGPFRFGMATVKIGSGAGSLMRNGDVRAVATARTGIDLNSLQRE